MNIKTYFREYTQIYFHYPVLPHMMKTISSSVALSNVVQIIWSSHSYRTLFELLKCLWSEVEVPLWFIVRQGPLQNLFKANVISKSLGKTPLVFITYAFVQYYLRHDQFENRSNGAPNKPKLILYSDFDFSCFITFR